MTTTQIILLILGIVILIISFFVIDRNEELDNELTLDFPSKQMTEDELLALKHQIQFITEEEVTRSMEETKEILSKMSNETIMSVHEYSEQVLAKIEKNHEEVVFLYSMLATKEEDYKKLYSKMESVKGESSLPNSDTKKRVYTETSENVNQGDSMIELETLESMKTAIDSMKDLTTEDAPQYKTEAILKLYNQNYSVLDISKKLGIGQGEVQLVIGVYGKSRG